MRKSTKMVILLSLLVLPAAGASAPETGGVEKKAVRWSRGSSINEYLDSHKDAVFPREMIVLNASSYDSKSSDAEVKKLAAYSGTDDVLQWTGETGTVTWKFDATETGMYHLALDYIPLVYKGMSIEFGVKG